MIILAARASLMLSFDSEMDDKLHCIVLCNIRGDRGRYLAQCSQSTMHASVKCVPGLNLCNICAAQQLKFVPAGA